MGALTGVGIWLSASLVSPYAIGSLIRVFFWAWFTEWLVFVTEVVLILVYYLTWQRWRGARKRAHNRMGIGLAVASWLTMALIVSILGFMMDPGAWRTDRTLLSGVLNPAYLPQLAFRTPLAMTMAGTYGLVATLWAGPRDPGQRAQLVRAISRWTLFWIVPTLLGGWWYATIIPSAMRAHLSVAMLTQGLETWATQARWVLVSAGSVVAALMAWGALVPRRLPRGLFVVPALLAMGLLGMFERVREFVRKPYAIAGYLYSNGYRAQDYPLLQRDGVLKHATYAAVHEVTSANQFVAGREVFMLACTRCHTVNGINGLKPILARMYDQPNASGTPTPWRADDLNAYLGSMHRARPFMPPFPGNAAERQALATWLVRLQHHNEPLLGAQTTGVVMAP